MRCEAGIWGYHQSKEVQNNKKCEAIEKLIDLHIRNIFNSKGTAWWLLIPLMIEIVSTYKCQRSASTFAISALLEFRPNHITCQNHAQMKPNSLPKVWHKKLHSHLKRRKDVEIRIAQSSWGEHQWEEDTAVDLTGTSGATGCPLIIFPSFSSLWFSTWRNGGFFRPGPGLHPPF